MVYNLLKAHTFITNKSLIGNDSVFQTQITFGPWMYNSAHKQVFLSEWVNQATVAKVLETLYFGLNCIFSILCFWSPLNVLSKLLAIQDHAQNLEGQLWMVGRREVSIISHRPLTSSDLKRFFVGVSQHFCNWCRLSAEHWKITIPCE